MFLYSYFILSAPHRYSVFLYLYTQCECPNISKNTYTHALVIYHIAQNVWVVFFLFFVIACFYRFERRVTQLDVDDMVYEQDVRYVAAHKVLCCKKYTHPESLRTDQALATSTDSSVTGIYICHLNANGHSCVKVNILGYRASSCFFRGKCFISINVMVHKRVV